MNQTQPYMDMHSSHLSSAQSYAPQGATAGSLPHYQQYQQPPVMQQGSTTYAPASSTYPSYGYPNGVTSPQSGSQPSSTGINSQVPAQLLPLPAMSTTAAGPPGYVPGPPGQHYSQHPMDTTGQVAPPGMKPRVTATLWEDEGSLCYQVEAKGVCVARREDNHMINGTKLLNVAGMTRGRRDGILKSEKIRHVVKIGPMHLKGVWIPFERALDFANKEKITEQLYPLFVHNIGGLLYHPTNQNRTNAIVAASERRRLEGNQAARTPQGSQAPTLHHHHSMHNPATGAHMSQPPHSIAPHPAAGRPGLDRAHTFPTPPTSASSIIGANQGSSYEWGGQNMGSNMSGSQPLSIDTGLSNARSMPTTPATTPPGTNMQPMQPYQGQPGYDNSKSYYSQAPSSQAPYAPHQPIGQEQPGMARYGQPISTHPYMKNDMGPPTGRSSGSETQPNDTKADQYTNSQGNVQVGHGTGEGGAENEHQPEYINDNSAYNANRGSYTYTANPPVAAIPGEHSHLSPEMTGSPSHPNSSGRGTPRTTGATQAQWPSGYNTPPRAPPSSNVFHVMSDTRGSGTNGTVQDAYSSSAAPPAYPAPSMNGNAGSNKRGRDDDEHDQGPRHDAHEADVSAYEHKRRKTLTDANIGGPVRGPPIGVQAMAPGIVSRRR